MHAHCIICHELFENSDDQVISALYCGHTFHNVCLSQWLENGRTCPSCRHQVDERKIINRLYFDTPEDIDENVDEGQMKNEIDNLKLEIRRKEKQKNDVMKEKEKCEEQIGELVKAKKMLQLELKAEQSRSSSQLKTLRYYESQQKSLELEREECRNIKQRMFTLKNLETLLNGVESDAAEIISSTGEGPSAIQTLSRQVAFMKREYEKIKLEKRQMKDYVDKLQMNESMRNRKIQILTKECDVLKDQLERSEGDLKLTEKHVELLKQKNAKLQSSLKKMAKSPSSKLGKDLNSSSFTELLNDSSKMNALSASTPKLSAPCDKKSENVDLDCSFDLFTSPSPVKNKPIVKESSPSPGTSQTQSSASGSKRPIIEEEYVDNDENSENGKLHFFKITSAAESSSQKSKKFKTESAILKYANMNIFKKKELGERYSDKGSIIHKGFDGLGGHTTHVNSLGNPFKIPGGKKKIKVVKKNQPLPKLPKLDDFVVLD